VKTHPHLLVRDVLAELFVRAAAGDAEALQTADELAAWASGDRLAASERLCELKVEDGGALFEPGGGVAERFAGLDAYVRDRARRYAEALRWIAADAASASVIDRAHAGLFFEVHEVVEPAWLEASGDQRTLLQGIIMAGAALHHLVGGNTAGARGLLRDAARRLSAVPEPADLAVGAFASALDALAERVDAGSIPLDEVLESLPRLERRSGTTAAEN